LRCRAYARRLIDSTFMLTTAHQVVYYQHHGDINQLDQ